MAKAGKGGGTIVIRREEVVEGGHHGGAWKVAYADFVTAMMAFFLLMWLLNATTEAQRHGIADYFTPNNVLSDGKSGNGKIFGGHTPYDHGDQVSDRGAKTIMSGHAPVMPDNDDPDADALPDAHHVLATDDPDSDDPARRQGNAPMERRQDGAYAPGGGEAPTAATETTAAMAAHPSNAEQAEAAALAAAAAAAAKAERRAFETAADQIRAAVAGDPGLVGIMQQLSIDQTPEGLRIQLMDEDKLPMFASGSAAPVDRARLLLQKIAPVLAKLTESISIAGHTDATPFPALPGGRGEGRSNWDLSSERANATRRLLVESGLQESRIRSVTGNADRDLLLPADPKAAANRRIAIVVLRARPSSSVH